MGAFFLNVNLRRATVKLLESDNICALTGMLLDPVVAVPVGEDDEVEGEGVEAVAAS